VELCLNQSQAAGMVAQVAVEGNRELAFFIIEADNSISKKVEANYALEWMLDVHADILPQF